jgi:hypothetical protein
LNASHAFRLFVDILFGFSFVPLLKLAVRRAIAHRRLPSDRVEKRHGRDFTVAIPAWVGARSDAATEAL